MSSGVDEEYVSFHCSTHILIGTISDTELANFISIRESSGVDEDYDNFVDRTTKRLNKRGTPQGGMISRFL